MRTLRIRVKPNARQASLVEGDDGVWLAAVTAPPVDGKANEELLSLVARHLGVRRAQVTIKAGASARIKTVVIDDR